MERFKKEFYDRYFLAIVRQQKSKDFVSLVQVNMMVEQYQSKFIKLGRFAPHLLYREYEEGDISRWAADPDQDPSRVPRNQGLS